MGYLGELIRVSAAVTAASAVLLIAPCTANADPRGPDVNVIAGSAHVERPSPVRIVVHQYSERAVLHWRDFALDAHASLEFRQPDPASIAVIMTETGEHPVQVMGALRSNGRIVLLDASGVDFGVDSRVDVGGLVASTGGIEVSAFMAGSSALDLTDMTSAAVQNPGAITAAGGGLVAFLASRVLNSGTIDAPLGRVELGAGREATLDLRGESAAPLVVHRTSSPASVENRGTITADGGIVALITDSGRRRPRCRGRH